MPASNIYILKTNKNEEILLDEDIYNQFKNKYVYTHQGYPCFEVKGKEQRLSRYIMNAPKELQIDHINRNRLDNRRCNLRLVNKFQNSWNKEKYKTKIPPRSRYKGVVKCGNNWRSRISVNGKRIYLGSFKTEKEAALAYNEACKIHHGEYGVLNDIKGLGLY